MKKIELGIQHRALKIQSGNIDEDARTVDLSFSSEEPVERWFGTEILDHKSSSVDLARLNNNAALLVDHGGDQIGAVVAASINEKGIGVAKVKFSKGARGEEVYQDVKDGIRTNVSFGYRLKDLTLESETEGENPVYRSFNWEPFEISIVGVPADHTIGVGRSEEETNEIEVEDNFRDLPTLNTNKKEIEKLIDEDLNESETEDNDIENDNSHARAKLVLANAASKGIK